MDHFRHLECVIFVNECLTHMGHLTHFKCAISAKCLRKLTDHFDHSRSPFDHSDAHSNPSPITATRSINHAAITAQPSVSHAFNGKKVEESLPRLTKPNPNLIYAINAFLGVSLHLLPCLFKLNLTRLICIM